MQAVAREVHLLSHSHVKCKQLLEQTWIFAGGGYIFIDHIYIYDI